MTISIKEFKLPERLAEIIIDFDDGDQRYYFYALQWEIDGSQVTFNFKSSSALSSNLVSIQTDIRDFKLTIIDGQEHVIERCWVQRVGFRSDLSCVVIDCR